MDEDTRELIVLLCTKAGMVMEDVSVEALSIGQTDLGAMQLKLVLLEDSTELIASLIGAAKMLAN